ncbi:MAG: hypothetical protein AABY13_06115 [Nanoarchaeota archaeon]
MTKKMSVKKTMADFAGIWKDLDTDAMKKTIAEGRKRPLRNFFATWPGTKDELDCIEKELAKERRRVKTRRVIL